MNEIKSINQAFYRYELPVLAKAEDVRPAEPHNDEFRHSSLTIVGRSVDGQVIARDGGELLSIPPAALPKVVYVGQEVDLTRENGLPKAIPRASQSIER